ncbi:hypothetical protein MHU86_25718 [Fragilaria crotonensis]|nr:hypothetical protein MHU86_25718 [Fragilaria crotonensis]
MSVVPMDKYIAVETRDTLPHDVQEIAVLINEVIAWTSFDPRFARDVGIPTCCRVFDVMLALPCFCPPLLIFWPFLCSEKTNFENRIRNQYWILTETELKVVTKDHDACCLPGCIKAGDSVQTIPLEGIADCWTDDDSNAFVITCLEPLPMVYVYTGTYERSDDIPQHEAIGYGLARRHSFIREVLNRRDIVKGNHSLNASERGVAPALVISRGDSPTSAADRMKDITELLNGGVLTGEEFLQKRKDIIDSIFDCNTRPYEY